MRPSVLLAAALLAACATPAPAQPTAREMAAALAAQASYCSTRRDTEHPVFHGCVDWHSSVHGLWALALYTRLTGDDRHRAQIEAALNPEGLRREVEFLRAHPDFETPYGRAWLLRLHTEWKRIGGDDRLDELAQIAAESLVERYARRAPNPLAERYDSDAWAILNLLQWARANRDAALANAAISLVRTHFMRADQTCPLETETRGFIAVCTTWAWLVAESAPRDAFRAWYARWNPGLETLAPVAEIRQAHDYGRNFSRAWSLYYLAQATGDARLRESYYAHLHAGFEPRSNWRGAYLANGHWVAQFGMLALEPMFSLTP